ncbi:mRNA-binding ribosome synthesis protein nop7 [Pseudocyphellaria aurata]|nr:mRNA-binding ribosome synthesis protein nop7 [Pseudocyphellaria aurata]
MATLSHFVSFLGDVNNRDEKDSPESAIVMRASAQRRSRKMYRRLVKRKNADSGMSANKGNNNGACVNGISTDGPNILPLAQLKLLLPGTAGQARNFITRTQAVRKLQISLPDFRRLCIFKGIYPREPRNKKKASKSSTQSTTFYYTKDIQYLLHEPLLNKFRDHKALAKKIAKSLGRGEVGDAARLEKKGNSRISLDHIIKERYPTFIDALRDLDDALSLLSLFANLPATATVPPKTIALCQRLCLEFQHYLIITNSLRKSFLSIKGIYYQVTIQGQDILWLVPYKFVQRVTGDVDFRIMGTFVEFYTTLLGFVNFRLYNTIGLIYPPKFDAKSDDQGGELGAFTLEGKGIDGLEVLKASTRVLPNENPPPSGDLQKKVDALNALSGPENEPEPSDDFEANDEINDAIDTFEPTGEGADILPQPHMSGSEAATLFAPFSFYLSRETPRQPLEFILRAFGCKRVGWDAVLGDGAFTHNENDTSITHQIVDRPPLKQTGYSEGQTQNEKESVSGAISQALGSGGRIPGRIYVQPQWAWDCINQAKLLRPDLYAPGATLPPHLSPWVKPSKGEYDPSAPLAEQEREGEAEEAEGLDEDVEEDEEEDEDEDEDEDEEDPFTHSPETTTRPSLKALTPVDPHGMEIAGFGSDSDISSHHSAASSFSGFDSDAGHSSSDESTKAQSQHQRELLAEASGLSFPASTSGTKTAKGALKRNDDGRITTSSMQKGDEARRKAARKRRKEDEELERRKMMMGRKKRKMVEKMLFGNAKREAEAGRLRAKRRKIEKRARVHV